MEQIKGIIDRMGGIDGIVNSMGKVQKVMSGFQQMAPMVKLFMGNFGKNKGSSGALAAEEDAALYSPNRRKKDVPPRPAANLLQPHAGALLPLPENVAANSGDVLFFT